jgi:hypothetical protein
VASVPAGHAFRFHAELLDRLFNRRLEGLGRESAGRRSGDNRGSLRGEGLLGDFPICSYTLVDGHSQSTKHNRDDPVVICQKVCWKEGWGFISVPSSARATNQVEMFAWSRYALEAFSLTDLFHDILQDQEAGYAADTSSIWNRVSTTDEAYGTQPYQEIGSSTAGHMSRARLFGPSPTRGLCNGDERETTKGTTEQLWRREGEGPWHVRNVGSYTWLRMKLCGSLASSQFVKVVRAGRL